MSDTTKTDTSEPAVQEESSTPQKHNDENTNITENSETTTSQEDSDTPDVKAQPETNTSMNRNQQETNDLQAESKTPEEKSELETNTSMNETRQETNDAQAETNTPEDESQQETNTEGQELNPAAAQNEGLDDAKPDPETKPAVNGIEIPQQLQRHISVPVMSVQEKRTFYRTIFSPCRELSQELKEKAQTELNETDALKTERLSELRSMLTREGDTPKGDAISEFFGGKDDKYLVRFLRTKKYDVKRTYDAMAAYVKFRAKYSSVTERLNFKSSRHALEMGLPGILPVKDKQGHVVMIYDNGAWDMNKLPFDEMLAAFLFVLENLIENEESQIRGFVIVETYEKYHINQAKQMKASDLKKLANMVQGAFPGRFKGFHVIRQPWYFSMVMKLARPFMRNKLASRIFVHGNNLKGLYNIISPQHLPPNFGGIGEPYDPKPLIDELKECLLRRGEFTFAQAS